MGVCLLDKTILKDSFGLFGKYIICVLTSLVIVFSLAFVFTTASTAEIGYTVYATDEQGNAKELYTHMNADGEDTKMQEYEEQGLELKKIGIYSELGGAPRAAMMIISQICTLGTVFLFMYGKVYYVGDSDANKVAFERIKYDRFKGFKMGAVPAVFSLVFYVWLVLGKLGIGGDISLAVFRLINYHLFAYCQLIFGDTASVAELGWGSIIAAFLTVVLIPIICQMCYILGYKRISVFEKLVFKKK